MASSPLVRILAYLRGFPQAYTILLFLLLAAGVAFVVIRVVPPFPVISDFADYDFIAQSLATSGTYATVSADHLIYPPLYPLFLAALYTLFGHTYIPVYAAQYLMLGCIGACVYLLLRRYGSVHPALAALAGGAVILWPYFLLYAYLVSSEVLYTLLLVAGTLALFEAFARPSHTRFALVGVLWGLAALARPVILLLPAWLILGSWVLSRFGFGGDLWDTGRRFAATLCIAYLATAAPWVIYAYAHFDRLIPISSNFSVVWEKGNQSLSYLEETPAQAHTLQEVVSAKVRNLFLFWDPGASGYQMEGLVRALPAVESAILFYRIVFYLTLFLAGAALVTRRRLPWILWAGIGYVWAVHTVLFPFPRYTLPIIPLVVVAAAWAMDYFWKHGIVSGIHRSA